MNHTIENNFSNFSTFFHTPRINPHRSIRLHTIELKFNYIKIKVPHKNYSSLIIHFFSVTFRQLVEKVTLCPLHYPVVTISQVSSNRISDYSRDDNTLHRLPVLSRALPTSWWTAWLVGYVLFLANHPPRCQQPQRELFNRPFDLRETSSVSGNASSLENHESSFISFARDSNARF